VLDLRLLRFLRDEGSRYIQEEESPGLVSGMADVFSRSKRSEIMSLVRSKGNRATEIALIKTLRLHRIAGWRRCARVFGSPDFVFPKHRLAVFVDGCFWHGCPMHATQPSSNRAFWKKKLARNKARDRLVVGKLKQRGWGVLRIWQHEFSRRNGDRLVKRIQRALSV
jgi:DNA mismatch endonuclease (patch repair protein)